MMPTQMLGARAPEATVGIPWLEPRGGPCGVRQRTPVNSLPFTIGRGELTDLQLDCSRVSRNHAIIVLEHDVYRVRDTESTNGTWVNGRRIKDSPLCDGDLLQFADIQFTFRSGNSTSVSQTTKAVAKEPTSMPAAAGPSPPGDLVRRLDQITTLGCMGSSFQPLLSLADGGVVAYEALSANRPPVGGMITLDSLPATGHCPPDLRRKRLQRLVAIEGLRTQRAVRCLVMTVTATEMMMADELVKEMRHLCFSAPQAAQIVLGIPASTLAMGAKTNELCRSLRSTGVRILYSGMTDVRGLLPSNLDNLVDFFRISPSLVRGIDSNARRQRCVRSIVVAGATMEIPVIARGIKTENEATTCLQLGCLFAQGEAREN